MPPKKNRLKAPAVAVNVPQNREMAAAAVAEIGVAQRELARLQAAMNDELAVVKERWEEQAQPLRSKIEAATTGLQMFFEANRAAMTNNYKVKTVELTTGKVLWRMNPPSVRLLDDEATVIAACESLGLKRFVDYQARLDKNAIKADPDAAQNVPGLRIGQSEAFVVEPFEVELAEVA